MLQDTITIEIEARPIRPELIPDNVRYNIGQAAFEAFRRYAAENLVPEHLRKEASRSER